MNEKIFIELLNEAKKASKNAYCSYSNFPVGSAVLFESQKIYSGCNIENDSYGLTLCAERAAISNAISNGEKTKIKAISIYSPKKALCYPCGACRQWINEFKSEDAVVILEDENKKPYVLSFDKLFPHGFKLL